MEIDHETGEISSNSTQGRILSAINTLKTFPEAMSAAVRPTKVIEAAFRDIWESICTQLEVPVLYGVPE